MLSLLIQIGLLGRVMSEGLHCPSSVLEHHCQDHGCDDSHGEPETGSDSDHSPKGKEAHSDCAEHHHGNCIHNLQLSIPGDVDQRLLLPRFVLLSAKRHHLRPPLGPVFEMDKPPLI